MSEGTKTIEIPMSIEDYTVVDNAAKNGSFGDVLTLTQELYNLYLTQGDDLFKNHQIPVQGATTEQSKKKSKDNAGDSKLWKYILLFGIALIVIFVFFLLNKKEKKEEEPIKDQPKPKAKTPTIKNSGNSKIKEKVIEKPKTAEQPKVETAPEIEEEEEITHEMEEITEENLLELEHGTN